MKIKVKHIIIILIVVALCISGYLLYKNLNKTDKTTSVQESEIYEDTFTYEDNWFEIGYKLAKKNGNWTGYPLTEHFRSKYNEKDGILGDIQFDNIEYRPFAGTDAEYAFKNEYTYFVITQGKGKTVYSFSFKYDNEKIDDVELFPFEIVSKEGNTYDYEFVGSPIDEGTWTACFEALAKGGDSEKDVAVSEKFHKKYPYFNRIFEYYFPLRVGDDVRFDEAKSSFEKRIAIFDVKYSLEFVNRQFEIKFTIDDNNSLDDVVVKCLSEKTYDVKSPIRAHYHVFYPNINWDNLKLSDGFKSKYNAGKSILPYFNELDFRGSGLVSTYCGKDSIQAFKYKNGKIKWNCIKFIYAEKNYLDDVEILPIDYNGTNAEEALKKYKEQYNISD